MSDFSIRIKQTENTADKMDKMYRKILNHYDKVAGIRNNLYYTKGMTVVRSNLTSILSDIEEEACSMDILADRIRDIVSVYRQTENKIVGNGKVEEVQLSVKPEASVGYESQPEEKSWWEEFKELFDQDQSNDEWWQRLVRDLMLNTFTLGIGTVWMHLREIWDDDTDYAKVVRQVVGGNWVEDNSGLGIALSIVVSMIPVVGQIADVRDLVADIRNLTTDGATAEEWISLGLSTIAFIPIAGEVLKYGDEGAAAIKGMSQYAPELTKGTQKFLRKADDFTEGISNSKVVKKVQKIQDDISKKTIDKAKDFVRDKMDDIPGLKKVKEKVDDVIQDVRDEFTKPGKKTENVDMVDLGTEYSTKLTDYLLKNVFKETVGDFFTDKQNSLQAAS